MTNWVRSTTSPLSSSIKGGLPRYERCITMERLPPELCLRVLESISSIPTLGRFILSQQYVFRVFLRYRLIVLASVITAQFSGNARDAVFLATGQASGATCEDTRLAAVQCLNAFSWTRHQLDSCSLRKLSHIGNVVDSLSVLFTDTMAAEFWLQAVGTDPPSVFDNAEQVFKRALFRYWVLCELYAEFSPARRCFFWASSLDRRPFEEFYRPLSRREVLEMAFLEFCFFPRFMRDVCGECKSGVCSGRFEPGFC